MAPVVMSPRGLDRHLGSARCPSTAVLLSHLQHRQPRATFLWKPPKDGGERLGKLSVGHSPSGRDVRGPAAPLEMRPGRDDKWSKCLVDAALLVKRSWLAAQAR